MPWLVAVINQRSRCAVEVVEAIRPFDNWSILRSFNGGSCFACRNIVRAHVSVLVEETDCASGAVVAPCEAGVVCVAGTTENICFHCVSLQACDFLLGTEREIRIWLGVQTALDHRVCCMDGSAMHTNKRQSGADSGLIAAETDHR